MNREMKLEDLINMMPNNASLEKKNGLWRTSFTDKGYWDNNEQYRWGDYRTPKEALIAMFTYLKEETPTSQRRPHEPD